MAHRFSLLIVPALALAVAAASACGPAGPGTSPGAVSATTGGSLLGKSLPDVEVSTLAGAPTRLQAEFGGRPALVSFWASWCDACIDEVPALNKLAAATKNDGVVLGVAVGESTEKARGIVAERSIAYPNLVDTEFKLADALGQRNVPFTMVVDREGQVVFTGGALDQAAVSAFERARR